MVAGLTTAETRLSLSDRRNTKKGPPALSYTAIGLEGHSQRHACFIIKRATLIVLLKALNEVEIVAAHLPTMPAQDVRWQSSCFRFRNT